MPRYNRAKVEHVLRAAEPLGRGTLQSHDGRCCALGALIVGTGLTPEEMWQHYPDRHMPYSEAFGALLEAAYGIPGEACQAIVTANDFSSPECRVAAVLRALDDALPELSPETGEVVFRV